MSSPFPSTFPIPWVEAFFSFAYEIRLSTKNLALWAAIGEGEQDSILQPILNPLSNLSSFFELVAYLWGAADWSALLGRSSAAKISKISEVVAALAAKLNLSPLCAGRELWGGYPAKLDGNISGTCPC